MIVIANKAIAHGVTAIAHGVEDSGDPRPRDQALYVAKPLPQRGGMPVSRQKRWRVRPFRLQQRIGVGDGGRILRVEPPVFCGGFARRQSGVWGVHGSSPLRLSIGRCAPTRPKSIASVLSIAVGLARRLRSFSPLFGGEEPAPDLIGGRDEGASPRVNVRRRALVRVSAPHPNPLPAKSGKRKRRRRAKFAVQPYAIACWRHRRRPWPRRVSALPSTPLESAVCTGASTIVRLLCEVLRCNALHCSSTGLGPDPQNPSGTFSDHGSFVPCNAAEHRRAAQPLGHISSPWRQWLRVQTKGLQAKGPGDGAPDPGVCRVA